MLSLARAVFLRGAGGSGVSDGGSLPSAAYPARRHAGRREEVKFGGGALFDPPCGGMGIYTSREYANSG